MAAFNLSLLLWGCNKQAAESNGRVQHFSALFIPFQMFLQGGNRQMLRALPFTLSAFYAFRGFAIGLRIIVVIYALCRKALVHCLLFRIIQGKIFRDRDIPGAAVNTYPQAVHGTAMEE